MAVLLNAPLRYTLALMRFPKVIDFETLAGAVQRLVSEEGYPLSSEQQQQAVEVAFGENGPEMRTVQGKLWQFADLEQSHALILGPDFLVLHAGRRDAGHADFLGRFGRMVDTFSQVEGGPKAMTALGYRYVDLVVPNELKGETLADYLEPGLCQGGREPP